MEVFTYKGISSGKYVEGEIEALNQDEASFKLKEQKVIITNLIKTKKKKGEKKERWGCRGRKISATQAMPVLPVQGVISGLGQEMCCKADLHSALPLGACTWLSVWTI